jgi:hypothetical protein
LLYPALAIGVAASIATHIAKALVKDPKAQKILGISNMVIDFAAGALLGGVLVRTINSLKNPAVSNSVHNAPAVPTQRPITPSVNENVYFMPRTNKVVLQYSPQPALQNPELRPPYSQVAGVTPLNSAQRRHSSPTSSDALTMRGFRQHT